MPILDKFFNFFSKNVNLSAVKSDSKNQLNHNYDSMPDPVEKTIELLTLWRDKYSQEMNLINPENLTLCSDKNSIELFLKYAGDTPPLEVSMNYKRITYKQTITYFYGLYLYKELTGEIYNSVLSHKNILRPGIYQFLRSALQPEMAKRTKYPDDLIFLLNLRNAENMKEAIDLNHNGMRIELFSTIGLFRKQNQDSCEYEIKDKENFLLVLADGMGGGSEGKKAATMAVNLVKENYKKFNFDELSEDNCIDEINFFIKKTVLQVNKAILNYSSINKLKDMGTTLSFVIVSRGKFYFGHVGDSRIYLIRNSTVQLLSLDQSNVEILFREGKISENQKESFEKNVLIYFVGCDELTESEICVTENSERNTDPKQGINLEEGDTFFLCSDGVWGVMDENKNSTDMMLPYEELKDYIFSMIPTDNFSFIRVSLRAEK